jgi:predicted ATPase
MLKALELHNFTVFPDARLELGHDLNIIIGENGTGKSHLLKAAYCGIAASAQHGQEAATQPVHKPQLQRALAEKLQAVFRPDGLGRLVRRQRGRSKCRMAYTFDTSAQDISFHFSTLAKTEVTVETVPSRPVERRPVFLPTRELLSIYPGFVPLYETTHLPFEETWRDTCILLGAPLARGPRESRIKGLLTPLETAMGGTVELDNAGRFYLNLPSGSMEMHLVAEGLRKLAMVARLVATGSLLDKGYLFWDEPEANLNPRIIKIVARTILKIAESGIQVFIATHSLFLMRELHILQLQRSNKLGVRCFGLSIGDDDCAIMQQGDTMDDVGGIAALDEDLQQSERYIDGEMQAGQKAAGQTGA